MIAAAEDANGANEPGSRQQGEAVPGWPLTARGFDSVESVSSVSSGMSRLSSRPLGERWECGMPKQQMGERVL